MPGTRSPRRLGAAAAALAAAGLSLSACSSVPSPVGPGGGSPSPTSPSASSSSSAETASQTLSPLTGLPAASAADAGKPAVALALAGPDPTGLTSADLVFQEFSAPVRFIAVFQSKQATAGPVTSTQPADGIALSVLHPLVGYDGAAAPYFVTALDRSKVKDAGYSGHPSLYTAGTNGLTASTQTIAGGVTGETAPPQLLRYRGASTGDTTLASTGVSHPTSARITIPGNGTETWSFDQQSDRWELTGGGPRVSVANVVVQMVSYKTIGINARAGRSTQVAELLGNGHTEALSGSATGGSGGTAASGTWAKPHLGEVTTYLDSSAAPMAFQPGPTWIILAPPGSQVSTSG